MKKKENLIQTQEPIKTENSTFFVSIPILKFSSIQSPCLSVQIEGKIFSMELDLGLVGDVAIGSSLIDQISVKVPVGIKSIYGFRGKEYKTNLYRIPKIAIGGMSFIQPILQETSEEARSDSVVVENKAEPSVRESGRIGWELFHNVNLLLDLNNSKLAFCDSFETLQKNDYFGENFIKTPLLIDRGIIEFQVETTQGVLRCMLDSGSTLNLLNIKSETEKSIEEVLWDNSNSLKYSSFKIEGSEFGPLEFHKIPIQIPIQIEAILGMEFLKKNLIFLDFEGKWIYFLKNQ